MCVNSSLSVGLQDAQLMAIAHQRDGDGWQDFVGSLSSAFPREKDHLQSQLFFIISFHGCLFCTAVFCLFPTYSTLYTKVSCTGSGAVLEDPALLEHVSLLLQASMDSPWFE